MKNIFLLLSIACVIISLIPAFKKLNSVHAGNRLLQPMITVGIYHYSTALMMALIILISPVKLPAMYWELNTGSVVWIICISVCIVLFNLFSSNDSNIVAGYHHLLIRQSSIAVISFHFGGWFVYLLFYEWLLRGIVLYSGMQIMDEPFAILITVLLYAIMHLTKGWKEVAGSVPLGLLLCIGVTQTQCIWIAIIPHIIMALSFESFVLIRKQIHHKKNYML